MSAGFPRERAFWAIGSVLLMLLVATLVYVAARHPPPPSKPTPIQELSTCWTGLAQKLSPPQQTPQRLDQISSLCYNHARRSYLIENYSITRQAYLQQQFQGNVMLWMVVSITLSGVALAGLQLGAAFRLASAGKGDLSSDAELSLERGRISLKSSVTGLLILTVSFAFFSVYVVWVYTLKDDDQESPAPAEIARPVLEAGGLGPPPRPLEAAPK